MFNKPDTSNIAPRFSKTEDDDAIDLGWAEGIFTDSRPYRCESWATGGISLITVFFSSLQLENSSNQSLSQLLVSERLLHSASGEINVEGLLFEDASGNAMWSVNVVISDEEKTYAESNIQFKEYIKFTDAIFLFSQKNKIDPSISYWLPAIFRQGAEEAEMSPEDLVMLAIHGDKALSQHLIGIAEETSQSEIGKKEWTKYEVQERIFINKYDIIGDVHGHGNELVKLLVHLGYHNSVDGYYHKSRKVIFLGDFIDRGEELVQHKQVLKIVMDMVKNKNALAVMGNHEFNALAYHTKHNGRFLRPHTTKNSDQHRAFLNEFPDESEEKLAVIDFFYTLPLWLEIDGLRAIHACWDDKNISVIRTLLPSKRLDKESLIAASTKGTKAYQAIEVLLKGFEYELPEGTSFHDPGGTQRTAARLQWWKPDASKLGEVVLPNSLNIGAASSLPLPKDIPVYGKDEPPCFIGHYWLNGEPAPLAENVACLDYSVAKQGKLVAYRWDGEQVLEQSKFSYVVTH